MKKKIIIITAALICAAVIAGTAGIIYINRDKTVPENTVLTIETPRKISENSRDIFTADVKISALGENIYPAASFSIVFDNKNLEFTGIENGNLYIRSDTGERQLPRWKLSTEKANEDGKISIMYLDISGGKYAFSKDCQDKDSGTVFTLCFRLKDSAEKGDIYELYFEDAVFAANNKEDSLSKQEGTMDVSGGRIVIGD